MIKILLSKEGIIKIPKRGDIQTHLGIIKREVFKKAHVGQIITTHLGEPVLVTAPSYEDFIKLMKRGPQILTLKDIGEIIVFTNINKSSRVLDIGTGAGTFSIIISKIAKLVVSYDVREDYLALAKENAKILGAKNIKFKLGEIEEKEEYFDTAVMDVPDPNRLIGKAIKSVKKGGYVCVYLPSISQVSDIASKLGPPYHVMQTIKINWIVDPNKNILRPENMQLFHTGFLLIKRKIK